MYKLIAVLYYPHWVVLLSTFPLCNFPLFQTIIPITYCTNISVITFFNNNKKKGNL